MSKLKSLNNKKKKKLNTNYGPYVSISPPKLDSRVQDLRMFRTQDLPYATNISGSCGIMYVLASLNGSNTNYFDLSLVGGGEGFFRLLAVVYEVFTSAARVKNALSLNGLLPSICHSKNIELTLFTDRDIFTNINETNLLEDAKCVFDRIIYFDQLGPRFDTLISSMRAYKREDMLVRLGPRTNAAKLLAMLATPYQYTLYLDGDTSPCLGFQMRAFSTLNSNDIMTTANPLPFESTNGIPTYQDSPRHKLFHEFVEINGGIFAFKMTLKTEALIIRSIELIPFFASLGFDQDQAMMRHALFEGTYFIL